MRLDDVQCLWPAALAVPELHEEEVHVWAATLSLADDELASLHDILSNDELSRCERFPFVQDRNRFIAGRGSLRHLLSVYQHEHPAEVQFGYGHAGKPYLKNNTADIRFNISHSGELALIAVAPAREVGVDVEFMCDLPEMDDIALRFFSEAAKSEYSSAPCADRLSIFYKCWTEKEAVSKCTGHGITEENPQPAVGISIVPLEPAPGYVSSLAISGPAPKLRTWHWSPASFGVETQLPCPVASGVFL